MFMNMALGLIVLAATPAVAATAGDCPAPVLAAIEKAHPGSKISSCESETEDGTLIYEAGIVTAPGKSLELEIAPDGKILLTEESLPVEALPDAVVKGLAARHPGAKPKEAEKLTRADGTVLYEIEFEVGGVWMEATFSPDGRLVEIEDDDDEPDEDDD